MRKIQLFDTLDINKFNEDDFTRQHYESMKNDINNFSYWFPKIKDCGANIPKTEYFTIPFDVIKLVLEDNINHHLREYETRLFNWVNTVIMPKISNFGLFIFMKNGTFSNKFDARTCLLHNSPYDITDKFTYICYGAECVGAGGNTELVIREQIGNGQNYPTIYNGLPLRLEIRVFYDFDIYKVMYLHNYWDISIDKLYNTGDKIIFEQAIPQLQKLYDRYQESVEYATIKYMKNIDLTGQWSIDFMLADGKWWLIDMATAVLSAYYDKDWIKNEEINEER